MGRCAPGGKQLGNLVKVEDKEIRSGVGFRGAAEPLQVDKARGWVNWLVAELHECGGWCLPIMKLHRLGGIQVMYL